MGNTEKRTQEFPGKVKEQLGHQEKTEHSIRENYKFTDDETHLSCDWDYVGTFLKFMMNLIITFEKLGCKAVSSYL